MTIKMTREQYEKTFGVAPDFSVAKVSATPSKTSNIGNTIKEAFNHGLQQTKTGFTQAQNAKNPLELIEGGLKTGAGIASAAFSPLAPVTKPLEKGFNKSVDELSNIPAVQKFAQTQTGQNVARGAEDVANVATIGGAITGLKVPSKVSGVASRTIDDLGNIKGPNLGKYTKNVTNDIIPSADRMVNYQVSRALDLSPTDISNISKSTGNEVGRFLADKNLIRENKDLTQSAIKEFYQKNYDDVRTEIGKVQKTYQQYNIPRYVEALKQIQKKVQDVPGMQEVGVEIDNLLNKKEIRLDDVQRVKELMDNHFNLYKVTGDVGEGIAKEGLANMRGELKNFIEQEVKNNTGTDIAELNNNVSTARSIDDAIITRSTKGLTRSNLRIGDLGIFGIGMATGGPLTGLALLFGKKLIESPTVRLRIAKYLDGVSDVRKAKIKADLEKGKIPEEFNQFIKQKNSGKKSSK